MEIIVPDHIDEYIKALSSKTEKAQIAAYIDRQSNPGHKLKRPVSAPLQEDINELRPGPRRIFFFYDEGEIVLIHAFRKKTDEVPKREIKAAVKLREKYLNGGIK